MSNLPEGWAETTLGVIGHYWNGRAFKKSEWRPSGQGRPILRIQDLTGSNNKPNYFDGEADDRNVARPGDLLVSWAATLGVYEWSGREAVINQHIFKVESFIDRRFHRYLIEHVLEDLRRRAHGTGMVHVTRKVFDETSVLLPPLQEQERIVAAIDEQYSRVDAGRRALESARRRLDQLRTAAMRQALSGDWPSKPLADVTEHQTYGSSAKATPNADDGVPIVRMANIRDGRVDLSGAVKFLPRGHPDTSKFALLSGDLLFNRTNSPELVGKSAVYSGGDRAACFASYLIRVRMTEACDPRWAALYLNSPAGRRWAASVRTQQVGQANINGTKLAAMTLPLPPVHEQVRRLDEYERHLTIIDVLASSIDGAVERSDRLRSTILARALSGRLVPQDPTDEPASEQLARMTAERAGAPKSRRGQRA